MAKRSKKGFLKSAGWFDGSFESKPENVRKSAKSIYRNQRKNDKQSFARAKKRFKVL